MKQQGFINIIIAVIAGVIIVAGGYVLVNKKADQKTDSGLVVAQVDNPGISYSPTQGNETGATSTTSAPIAPLTSAKPAHISGSHNAFGFTVLKSLAAEDTRGNIFISPTSISLALSMVYNGASGSTKDAMQKTLQFQGLDISTINQESLGLINALKNPSTGVELSIANSVWARQGVPFNKDFLNGVARYFGAEIATLDFKNPKAGDTINAWVSKNTKGKIDAIVDPELPQDMVMYLINAVYFKGSWTEAFKKTDTREDLFTMGDGTKQKRQLMKRYNEMRYLETKDFQSVALPYGKNKQVSMYVFLPKGDVKNFVKTLNTSTWDSWINQYEEIEGQLLLPKFKLEYEKGLTPTLRQLGMGVAFEDNADFSGIGDSLKISEVKHKTYVDVNEEGTEAAAVTSVGIMTTSISVEPIKTFYMRVDHPFFVAIRENTTGEILFMGVIQNP